jgi:hypothetical protein
MKNRINKLMNEDVRMQKEIKKAEKHALFADDVAERRYIESLERT